MEETKKIIIRPGETIGAQWGRAQWGLTPLRLKVVPKRNRRYANFAGRRKGGKGRKPFTRIKLEPFTR